MNEALDRINKYTTKMNPNNYGQMIGQIVEIYPEEKHVSRRTKKEYGITPIRVQVMDLGKPRDLIVLAYNCDYTEILDTDLVVQMIYHPRTRIVNRAYCTELVLDSIRVLAKNIEITSEYEDEYYGDYEDDYGEGGDEGRGPENGEEDGNE